jgi:hypothetical protein
MAPAARSTVTAVTAGSPVSPPRTLPRGGRGALRAVSGALVVIAIVVASAVGLHDWADAHTTAVSAVAAGEATAP